MSRPFKTLLMIVGAIIGLLIIAAIALPLLFNPNNYRKQLTTEASQQIHRDLSVGDIRLSVFPWLQVRLSDVALSNAPGFGSEPFAQAQEISLGVKLVPLLLAHKVETTTVTLNGLRLNLAKNANGANNWSDLVQSETSHTKPTDAGSGPESGPVNLDNINVSGIAINDAAIGYANAQTNKQYSIEHLNLKTGAMHNGKYFPADLSLVLNSTAPQATVKITVDGRVLADISTKTYHVGSLKLDANLSGTAIPGGSQDVLLTGTLDFNQASGALKLSKAELQAAGLTFDTEIIGENLLGDKPILSGPVTINNPFSPRIIMTNLGMNAPVTRDRNALTDASFSAQYSGTFNSAILNNVNLKLDQTHISGNFGISDFATQAISFAVKADQLDADGYMAPKSGQPDDRAAKDGDTNSAKISTDALDALNLNGTIDADALTLSGLKLSDAHIKIAGARGSAKQLTLTAHLYGGQIVQSTRLGGGKIYATKTQLKTIDAGPLLKDLLGKDYVSGIGTLDMDVTSAGDTADSLRKSLNGTVSFNLQNGAVKGFNLGRIISKAQALFAGQLPNSTDNAPNETNFTSFSASGKISNGVLTSDDLDAKSPTFRLAGTGEVNLGDETIDYLAKPTIIASSASQGDQDLSTLRGITIPIQLSGNLFAPRYKLHIDDALKQKAVSAIQKQIDAHRDELNQKLGGQLGDKLSNALSKFLGGGKPATPDQPQQQPQQ